MHQKIYNVNLFMTLPIAIKIMIPLLMAGRIQVKNIGINIMATATLLIWAVVGIGHNH